MFITTCIEYVTTLYSYVMLCYCREKPLALYAFTTDKQAQKKLSASTSSGGYVVNDVMIHFGGVCVCVYVFVFVCFACLFVLSEAPPERNVEWKNGLLTTNIKPLFNNFFEKWSGTPLLYPFIGKPLSVFVCV